MFLGIDVGGTFTDAVLVDKESIYKQVKVPTEVNLQPVIIRALDEVLEGIATEEVERVVLSSTVVTNALSTGQVDKVLLAVMPGPGINIKKKFPVEPVILRGYVDHCGKIIEAPRVEELAVLAETAAAYDGAAVSGKFAVRNGENEKSVAAFLQGQGVRQIFRGAEMSGALNFVRRTNAAYFSAAVYRRFAAFAAQTAAGIRERGITAPIFILKADGGVLPLAEVGKRAVETIFTGPAASVLGVAALEAPAVQAVSLDIGETTTDIALWENGRPVVTEKGAVVAGYPTSVHSYLLRSLAIGGDSVLSRAEQTLTVGPERRGSAAALGGPAATLADALITAGYFSFGDATKAHGAILGLCRDGETPRTLAEQFVSAALERIQFAIAEMIAEWEKRPVYTVSDALSEPEFRLQLLIGVGGTAKGLVPALGKLMGVRTVIPMGAMVANAVGAALAKPTVRASLYADTAEGIYVIPEAGVRGRAGGDFNRAAAENILTNYLETTALAWGMTEPVFEINEFEEFNTIKNYFSMGKIIHLEMQLQPGILNRLQGREVYL